MTTDNIKHEMVLSELQFLCQSPTRAYCLACLADNDQLTRDSLETALKEQNVSHRTVLRTINSLQDQGYIASTENEYRLTALGEHVYTTYVELAGELVVDEGVQTLLTGISNDIFDFETSLLADAQTTVATDAAPFAALDRLLTLRDEADVIRELAPAVEARSVKQLAERLRTEALVAAEIVVQKSALDRAASEEQYAEAHAIIAESEVVDLYAYPSSLPLSVCLLDSTVALLPSEVAPPSVLVETDAAPVRDWADEFITQYRDEALSISP